jgi:hypothetical protein
VTIDSLPKIERASSRRLKPRKRRRNRGLRRMRVVTAIECPVTAGADV